ncbi:helix-turn-helix domain-containing protein [Enterocloster clostridioformis]|nr:RNA polymerase subunit sigma [Lachnoclostridium sp. YL32]NDO27622.1 helix-turn-helix domain-containing protein [Enterocloster clostridioformis]OXE70080.1 helix-turn-helix domain-containing protein [Enterocloster clostridioformis]QQR00223.1 helix-turn-helix domain-containing protein [Enterocloster clostridioformis]
MDFKEKLQQAKAGDVKEKEHIFLTYRPLLLKYAMVENRFDEDLYQELSKTLLNCIVKFCIN